MFDGSDGIVFSWHCCHRFGGDGDPVFGGGGSHVFDACGGHVVGGGDGHAI